MPTVCIAWIFPPIDETHDAHTGTEGRKKRRVNTQQEGKTNMLLGKRDTTEKRGSTPSRKNGIRDDDMM